MEFSLNGAELSLNWVNSGNSENLRNYWSMNWVHYKDLLCYLCLCGLVVSSLSLTQEILGSSPTLPFLYFINFFCHWIRWIQWKHLEKTPLSSHFLTHFPKCPGKLTSRNKVEPKVDCNNRMVSSQSIRIKRSFSHCLKKTRKFYVL